ncbi:MAG: hypothetical protein A2X77_06405 [Gammaproteobacteria bacterium GWE2_42_36]|nr:MAG: hypothetical protein A2X77_06405 [Gammaproteobacteria bacterium GWE2_42_36]
MIFIFFLTGSSSVLAGISNDTFNPELHPWSLMGYWGRTCKEPIGSLIRGQFTSANETLWSTEVAYRLAETNWLRSFFHPVIPVVQVAGNVTYRDGLYNHADIAEFDPYLIFRWEQFPWNHVVDTTLAFAEGVSYVTQVPWVEERYNDDTARFLNYLMFEATFAMPSHPEWQFLVRIHHRSGAYGLYGAGNTGSNNLGVGIRYYF